VTFGQRLFSFLREFLRTEKIRVCSTKISHTISAFAEKAQKRAATRRNLHGLCRRFLA
jgi:hypothetical protein